jgi:hypothetical protein
MVNNRRFGSGLCAFLVAVLAAAPLPAPAQGQAQSGSTVAPIAVLTEKNNGQLIGAAVGNSVSVQLTAVAGTPGSWVLDSISNAGASLTGPIGTGTAGAAGAVYTANFQALQPGVVTIKMKYVAAEAAGPALGTFSFTLNVANPATGAGPFGPTAPAEVNIARPGSQGYIGSAILPALAPVVSSESAQAKPGQGLKVADGVHTVKFADGSTLTATFSKGLAEGNGQFVRPDGVSFDGTYQDGQPVSGTITYGDADGSSYTGAIASGFPSGQGTVTTKSGSIVSATGIWDHQALTNGDITLRDGVRYIGGLDAQGRLDGQAKFYYPGGAVLETTFVAGNYSGKTTWFAAADSGGGPHAERTVVVDVSPPAAQVTGSAVETFANGYTLTGTVKDGAFDGPATYRGANSTLQATFADGRLNGPYVWTDRVGDRVSGTYRDGLFAGQGEFTPRHGRSCRGNLVVQGGNFSVFSGSTDFLGRPNGRGTVGCPGAEQMTGFWSHGRMVGLIVDRLPDGTVYRVDVGRTPSENLSGPAKVLLPDGDVALGRLGRDGFLEGRGSYTYAENGARDTGTWVHGILQVAEVSGV